MPECVTYLEVTLNGESGAPWDLTKELKDQGWEPVWGKYDYAYRWNGHEWDEESYWNWVNKLHNTLRKHNVWYSLSTYEAGKENFPVWWGW
jgi:hypothetical protein